MDLKEGDIDFKVIFAAENSNKFQKTRFLEGKISWGCGNTRANGKGHTLVDMESSKEWMNEWVSIDENLALDGWWISKDGNNDCMNNGELINRDGN